MTAVGALMAAEKISASDHRHKPVVKQPPRTFWERYWRWQKMRFIASGFVLVVWGIVKLVQSAL